MLHLPYQKRPEFFRLNTDCQLSRRAVLLGLGQHPGSNLFHDESLYRNEGTLTNMDPPTDWVWEPELGRWKQDFDGSNDEITAPNSLVLASGFTISQWLWWDGTNVVVPLRDNTSAGGTGTFFPHNNAGTINYRIGNTTLVTSLSSADYNNLWTNWTLTCAGASAEVCLYVNGVLKHSGTGGGVALVSPWHWGRNGATTSYTKMQGTDLLMHGRVLSAAEIARLADPSNVMLECGGVPLILPIRRRIFPAAAAPSGAISGSMTITASATGTVVGAGALAGLVEAVLTGSGTVQGAGILSGSSTISLVPAGAVVGAGILSGSSAVSISCSAGIIGAGSLRGSIEVSCTPSGNLLGISPDSISGMCSTAITLSGTLLASGSLAGSVAVSVVLTGVLGAGAPTQPGIEFVLPDNRPHFTLPTNKPHSTLPDNRPHFMVPVEV